MTTKTKTPTTLAARVAASRADLEEATRALRDARLTLADAEEAEATLLSKRRAGDKSVTALDLATARAEMELLSLDIEGAEARLRKAERNLVNDDTSLADAIASALRGVPNLHGVEIVTTTETPKVSDTLAAPVLYLVQAKAAKPDTISGRVAGEVEMVLARPAWARPLDGDDLADVLNAAQVYSDVYSLGTGKVGDHDEDRARIVVRGAWGKGLPTISRVNGQSVFSQTLAGRIAEHASKGRRGIPRQAREGGLGSTTALSRAVAGQGEVSSQSSTTKGKERTTTLVVEMAFSSQTVGHAVIAKDAGDLLRSLPGHCESGLGRCLSADLVTSKYDSTNPDKPLHLAARVVFTSTEA